MMLVRTYVAPSPIHGIGVFAGERIAEGHEIWTMHPLLDVVVSQADLLRLPERTQAFLDAFGYPHPNLPDTLVLDTDDGRFMNHQNAPNTRFLAEAGFATVRIEVGAEITCDYREFHPPERLARFPFITR